MRWSVITQQVCNASTGNTLSGSHRLVYNHILYRVCVVIFVLNFFTLHATSCNNTCLTFYVLICVVFAFTITNHCWTRSLWGYSDEKNTHAGDHFNFEIITQCKVDCFPSESYYNSEQRAVKIQTEPVFGMSTLYISNKVKWPLYAHLKWESKPSWRA